MQRACRLLLDAEFGVKEIASLVGYDSASSFNSESKDDADMNEEHSFALILAGRLAECRSAKIRRPPTTSQLISALRIPRRLILRVSLGGEVQQGNDDEHGGYRQGAIYGQFHQSIAEVGLFGRRFNVRRRRIGRRRRNTWNVRVESLGTSLRERSRRARCQFECLE